MQLCKVTQKCKCTKETILGFMFIQEKWINRNLSLISRIQQADETATDNEEVNSKDDTTSVHFEELSSLQKSVAQTTYLFKLVEKRQEFCPIIPGKVNCLFDMWTAWWVIKKKQKNPWISPQGRTPAQWPPATMLIRYLYILYQLHTCVI